jgi:hypothetical protein
MAIDSYMHLLLQPCFMEMHSDRRLCQIQPRGVYLFEQASREVAQGGSVRFSLTAGQWLALGPGSITFGLRGQPQTWKASEIRCCTFERYRVERYEGDNRSVTPGMVRILRHEVSQGILEFAFDQLANARLFFCLLETVVGIPIEEVLPPDIG